MKSPIVFVTDRADRINALRRSALAGRTVHLWVARDGRAPKWTPNVVRGDPTNPDTFRAFESGDPIVVVDVRGERFAGRIARAAQSASPESQVLILDRERGRRHGSVRDGVAWIDEGELLGEAIESVARRAVARRRVHGLRRAVGSARRVSFLVQHDPDPDAIASSLALRAVLGFTPGAAPIISCGEVTRPENRRLVRELGVEIERVSESELAARGPLILVDVQPSYFGSVLDEVAAVIDHHPPVGDYVAAHRDVRPAIGASATMALEYLRADGDAALTRGLATALLYGIITDTKSLTRAASDDDMAAFAFLFPRADHDALRRIQHPSYTPLALKRFGRALQSTRVERGLAYVHLGVLPRSQEHIVAQLAEFVLGIAGAEIAAVSGVFGGRLVMSARALSPTARLGELLREQFDALGSAGGHAMMAKAVVPLRALRAAHSFRDQPTLARRVRAWLVDGIASRGRAAPVSQRAASRASR